MSGYSCWTAWFHPEIHIQNTACHHGRDVILEFLVALRACLELDCRLVRSMTENGCRPSN